MKFLLFVLIISTLFSCQQQPSHSSDSTYPSNTNLLLDNEVAVYSLYSELAQKQSPWNNAFKVRPFLTSLFYQVLQNKIILYNPIFEDTVFHSLDKDVWLNILKNDKQLTFDTTQFNDLFFFEYWYLDTISDLRFEKKIHYWSPVKREKTVLKLAGKIRCTPISDKKTLASQIIYEFPLQDTLFENDRLNKKKLVKVIIDWAIQHPEKTYNPFTAEAMNKNELLQRLSLTDSSLYMPYNDINSILFVENWYYEPSSFSIEKEILSVAPVLYTFDNEEISKHILFVLHLKQKPFKLL